MPTLEQLQEAVQRDRAETLSTEAARREQAARRKRELEELDARMEREWCSDDPKWQESHRDADAARAEQRAARKYQEQREQAEREQIARDASVQSAREEQLAARKHLASQGASGYTEKEIETRRFWENFINNDSFNLPYRDLLESRRERDEAQRRAEMAAESSTQAAMDEKLAERRHWNNVAVESYVRRKGVLPNPGVLYNEHTGEIYIPANKEDGAGGWEAFSMGKRVHVDPKVERRFSWLSNGVSAVLTAATAKITNEPSVLMLQPIITNLLEAGLLANKYETQDYVMNNPHTNEVGISVSASAGKQKGGTFSISADCYGNVAIMHSPEKGFNTTADISGGVVHTRTNAPLAIYHEGESTSRGGSVSIPLADVPLEVSAGADVVAFCNPYTGEAYTGLSMNGSISLWSIAVPGELHEKTTKTTIKRMIQLMDEIYPEEGRNE